MREVTWELPNLHCDGCTSRIRSALAGVQGLDRLDIDTSKQTITLQARGPEVLAYVRRKLLIVGYPPSDRRE